MKKELTCEKCGKDKIFKSVEINQSIYDKSDDEYPKWVIESVTIEGTPILADVCVECGHLTFSVDPKPLRLKIEHNLAEILEKKKKLEEDNRVRLKYQSLIVDIEKLSLEKKNLHQIEQQSWSNQKQIKITELEHLIQKTNSEINDLTGKIKSILEQQRNKQNTLKELGLSSENNPDLVKKLVEEYESLKLALLKVEKKSKDLSQELQSIKFTSFVASTKLSSIDESISLIRGQIQEMENKLSRSFFNQR